MCFSATASFAASAILSASGTVCLKKAKTKKDLYLVSIPFLFSIQQLLEGFVWVYPAHGLLTLTLSYAFLFFAFLLWPIYIPFVSWINEVDPQRKKILKSLILFGAVGSLMLFVILFTQPLEVGVVGQCIRYGIAGQFEKTGIMLYIIVTIGAFLISSNRFLKWYGFTALIAAWISWVFYQQAFTSVWCFFGAILSLIIVTHFYKSKNKSS